MDFDMLDEETLFKLSTDSNPAIMYLYNQIEETDRATEELLASFKGQMASMTQEWHILQSEVDSLMQEL